MPGAAEGVATTDAAGGCTGGQGRDELQVATGEAICQLALGELRYAALEHCDSFFSIGGRTPIDPGCQRLWGWR